MVCLDTTVIIDFLRGQEQSAKLIDHYRSKGEVLATTVVSVYELFRNPNERSRAEAEAFLSELLIYGMTETSARRSAEIHRNLKSKGTMINDSDIMITGIASANGEALVTGDKDFKSTGYEKLRIIEK